MMKKAIKNVYMMGICGTGMASLAGLLKEAGYSVSGSDQAAYPPMSVQLEEMGIKPKIGFDAANLTPRPDLIIIGNVIRRDNPEAAVVLSEKIAYLSMPQAVSDFFLKDKESIVITGTHGKTTISHIMAWLLESARKDPSFLIGGVGTNFNVSYRLSDGKYFVLEGDEYDTAFFDKGPKFLHYHPKYALITSIEFDHADIYRDLAHIKSSFEKLVSIISDDGLLVYNADSETAREIAGQARCRTLSYGYSGDADYRITQKDHSNFTLTHNKNMISLNSGLSGRHNLHNAAGAVALLTELGISKKDISKGLATFSGVKRRQEVRGIRRGVTVIDDFAHHPTAIKETISAVRSKYDKGRVWAIFEPRSNTTRRNTFQSELPLAFADADEVIIAPVFKSEGIPEEESLDIDRVVADINDGGTAAILAKNIAGIVQKVVKEVRSGDVVLIMSNGAFDNIHQRIIDGLKDTK